MKEKIAYILKKPSRIFLILLIRIPYFRFIRYTASYQCPISFGRWFRHKVLNLGGNKSCYWPVHFSSKIINPRNIFIGIDTCPGLMGGCYIQGIGKIYIGDYTQIASNVSIISANHELYDTRKHICEDVYIGKYCWLGVGSIVLPGVHLGDFTIVGAGAVVTKPFEEGFCILAGNPARKIRDLERHKCVRYEYDRKYVGYIRHDKFKANLHKYYNV